MKTLQTLQIQLLKSPADCKTDQYKDELYKVNEIIYRYTKRYINDTIKQRLLNRLQTILTDIDNTTPKNNTALKKKNYITDSIKQIYLKLYQYSPDIKQYDDCALKTKKYTLSQYLRDKQSILNSTDKTVDMLKEIKRINLDWKYQYPPLDKANDELLQSFITKYQINA